MSAQWELCQSIVHNRRFVLNGFEKGNFSNNELSFFLVRRSIRETIWGLMEMLDAWLLILFSKCLIFLPGWRRLNFADLQNVKIYSKSSLSYKHILNIFFTFRKFLNILTKYTGLPNYVAFTVLVLLRPQVVYFDLYRKGNIILKTINVSFCFSYRKDICLQTLTSNFLLIFKFANYRTKEPSVSPVNEALICTWISMSGVIDILAIRDTFGGGNQLWKSLWRKTLWINESLKERFRGIQGNMSHVALKSSLVCASLSTYRADWAVPFHSHGNFPLSIIHTYQLLKGKFPEHRFHFANQFVERCTTVAASQTKPSYICFY